MQDYVPRRDGGARRTQIHIWAQDEEVGERQRSASGESCWREAVLSSLSQKQQNGLGTFREGLANNGDVGDEGFWVSEGTAKGVRDWEKVGEASRLGDVVGPESETLKVEFLGRGRGWPQTGLEGWRDWSISYMVVGNWECPRRGDGAPHRARGVVLLSCLWQHEVKGRILTTEVDSVLSSLTLRTNMLDWRPLP